MFEGPVVLATDGSEDARAAAAAAVELSNRLDVGIHVLHVAAVSLAPHTLNPGEPRAIEDDLRGTLDDAVELVEELGGKAADASLREGRPADEIGRLCREVGAGMVVVGTRGRSRLGSVLGSVSGAVAREAPCPVVIVRADTPSPH